MTVDAAVIVPAYNGAATIRRAIESIVDSAVLSGRSVVISVADDASDDDTVSIVESLQTPKRVALVVTVRDQNQGTGAARNTAISAVSAPVLLFLDQDDEYLLEHIGSCLDALDATPRIDYVSTRVQLDRAIDPEWHDRIENSLTQNVAVRRRANGWIGGFLEDRATAAVGCDDICYRRMLHHFCHGSQIETQTVRFRHRPGNSFDRQLEKFARSPAAAVDTMGEDRQAALPAANAAFQSRWAEIARRASWLRRPDGSRADR